MFKNRGAYPSFRIPCHQGGKGVRDMRSYYSHAEAGAWEKQKGAPRPFRCQVLQAAPRLTLAASLLPFTQRTSDSTR